MKIGSCRIWISIYIVARQRLGKHVLAATNIHFFVIPFYLQSVQVHSANCVKMYTVVCRRGLSSALL
jgi:hypothetical protein